MKKIFLLSLLSVFLLSAFSQNSGEPELLAKISISKYIAPSEFGGDDVSRGLLGFFYRDVVTHMELNGDITLTCRGWGWNICVPTFSSYLNFRQIGENGTEMVNNSCQEIVKESDKLILNGEYSGTISQKIAIPDPNNNGKILYILVQNKWDHDPKYPYNGKAEITISITNKLGL